MSEELLTSESLAIRHRPSTLDDLVGNEAVATQIRGMLAKKRFPNAFLLEGGYGMGKTTTARIIARYVNCETMDACGTCPSCRALDSESNTDYTEKNVGAERGIDEIRDVITRCQYMPRYRLRIFVLDEVHALTTQASSALLKTLEEPPKKTMFILCTNRKDKLLDTIASRCTQLKMKAATEEDIAKRLWQIASKEGYSMPRDSEERKVLWEIAKRCDGHIRDAISMLESFLAVLDGGGTFTSEDLVNSYYGMSDKQLDAVAVNCLVGIATGNAKMVVSELVGLQDEHRSVIYKLRYLADNLISNWAGVAKYTSQPARDVLANCKPDINLLTHVMAATADVETILNSVGGQNDRIVLQSALLKLTLQQRARLQQQGG